LIGSAWGKTDVVVTGKANGTMPESTPARIRALPGVRDVGGMVGSVFVRLDAHGRAIKGQKGQMWAAGFDPAHSPYDFRLVQGRNAVAGAEMTVERNWARQRGVRVGDVVSVATPVGPVPLHVTGIFRLSSDLSF